MQNPNHILKLAVDEIANRISRGDNPNSAVVKVAKQQGLNMNMTKNAVAATNIALSFSHFKNNPDKRDSDFEIADISKIAGELVGDTKAEKKANMNFRTIGDKLPNFRKVVSDGNFKTAAVKVAKQQSEGAKNPYTKDLWDRVEKIAQAVQREVDDAEIMKIGAERDMTLAFAELVDMFATRDVSYRTPFAEFEKQAFVSFGQPAMIYIDHAYKTSKLTEKRGAHDDKYMAYSPCKELRQFEKFMNAKLAYLESEKVCEKAAVSLLQYKEAKAKLKACVNSLTCKDLKKNPLLETKEEEAKETPAHEAKETKQEEALEHAYMEAAHEAKETPAEEKAEELQEEQGAKVKSSEENFFLTPDEVNLPDEVKSEVIAAKKASLPALEELICEKVGFEFGDLPFAKKVELDVENEGKLRPTTSAGGTSNLDRKLILLELMHTDPILAHAPKLNILQNYSQLLQLAPNIALNKELVRSQLRSMISGQALSPFDAKQLVDTDMTLAKQRIFNDGSSLATIRL